MSFVFRACTTWQVATVRKWPGWSFWRTTIGWCRPAVGTPLSCSGRSRPECFRHQQLIVQKNTASSVPAATTCCFHQLCHMDDALIRAQTNGGRCIVATHLIKVLSHWNPFWNLLVVLLLFLKIPFNTFLLDFFDCSSSFVLVIQLKYFPTRPASNSWKWK